MVQPESLLDLVIDSPCNKHQEQPIEKSIPNKQEKDSKPSILVNIDASYFRICISLSGQALLWKTLSAKTDIPPTFDNLFIKLPSTAFLLIWCLSVAILVCLSILYTMRCIFYFNMVKAEFKHHVGVNYLFAPWISWLLLLQSAPSFIFHNKYSYEYVWWLLIIPVVGLDVKVYGQWFTTEKRFLSMVANPTSQLSVIGNFVGAHAAIKMGWRETGACLFTLGLAHYMVVSITLYQRLSGSNHLPSRLRPVFFQFVATPSMAALAWKSINGSFDIQCKMLFFLSLFLFTSLASRPMLFKKSVKEFSVAWWAFSFPLTFLALASTAYAQQVKSVTAIALAAVLSAISVLVFLFLLVFSTIKIDVLLNNPILKFSSDSV
ncbi:putative voltage-dependent anion channel [Helianthus annuus]|uniref:Voltage-dependent anion channel n=1 Tax=Helianthus annuus TaxID=4232 RepID=A0A251SA84_HELAN|nr:S-type anion channel SLAH1 [Helianthus annuus]KAF5763394.1 putative voltage-dependent anion channel [Helianthus annuus]